MPRPYCIYDVFTAEPLKGNPLAVVLEAEGLDDAAMQAIAKEFNLSETVFVLPPENPAHTARVRIFTPARELPFAGHPTVGAAVALSELAGGERPLDKVMALEENIGIVRSAIRLRQGEATFAEFDVPQKSSHCHFDADFDRQGMADALSISMRHIGFENHVPEVWTAGVPFLFVPVKDPGVLAEIDFDPMLWEKVAPVAGGHLVSAYVYCRGGSGDTFHARMFAPEMGVFEDPATGSAAAAFSGLIHRFDKLTDGHHQYRVMQGVEMGRASLIHLHVDTKGGEVLRTRIGGQAVRVASGTLEL